MSEFLLIHGAWHTAECWKQVTPILNSNGFKTCALTLPGHHSDEQPRLERIGLSTYVDAVLRHLEAAEAPVHLVGHSMSGIVLLGVASRMPEKIASLHFVSSFIPRPGQSIFDLVKEFHHEGLGPHLESEPEQNRIKLSHATQVIDMLYGEIKDFNVRQNLLNHLVDQPLSPMASPVHWNPETINTIPCIQAIFCSKDTCILLEDQEQMAKNLPKCETFVINASHSPELSEPDLLVETLLKANI